MNSKGDFAILEGSTILVTGVNGFISSHICSQLLQLGFKVRGTVRDTTKYAWVSEAMVGQGQKGNFELVSLPDLEQNGAFDSLVEGVSAVIHVASPLSLDPDPGSVIPRSIAGALNVLKAANRSPSVKRFVLTSSSVAAALPKPDQKGIDVSTSSWNIESVAVAWGNPSYDPHQAWHVFAASKVETERSVWKFYNHDKDRRQDLTVNTVLPGCNFGKALNVIHQGHPSTSSFIESLWYGLHVDRLAGIPPQYFVDVEDNARLHVACALLPSVQGERIFAWAEPFNFDAVLSILRTEFPNKVFVEDFHSYRDLSTAAKPRARALQLLQQLGKEGFTPLKESVLLNVEDLP